MHSVLTSIDIHQNGIYSNITYSKTSSFAVLFANKQNSGVVIYKLKHILKEILSNYHAWAEIYPKLKSTPIEHSMSMACI